MLELNVPNPVHANYLEQALGKWIKFAFIVCCEEDKELMAKYKESSRARFDYIYHIRELSLKHPVPTKDMKQFGVESYLDEVFDAPRIVKYELSNLGLVHRMVVGSQVRITIHFAPM